MPLTPFHYPIAYFIYKILNSNERTSKSMNLPALIVGSMILDIGGLLELLTQNTIYRITTHSLIGAITIGTTLSVIVTFLFYPTIINRFFKIDKKLLKAEGPSAKTVVT